MILSIDSYDVTRQIKDIADRNPDTEMAIAGGGKVIDGTRIFLQHALEYEGAKKQEGQVSITSEEKTQTHEKLAEKGYDVVAQGHQHLEKHNHTHDFSKQDNVSIKEQKEPVHLLLYKTQEGTVRLKVVDTTMQPVKLVVMGRSMDIATLFAGGNKVEEYKEVA